MTLYAITALDAPITQTGFASATEACLWAAVSLTPLGLTWVWHVQGRV